MRKIKTEALLEILMEVFFLSKKNKNDKIVIYDIIFVV